MGMKIERCETLLDVCSICAICGKEFRRTSQHAYRHGRKYMCSYKCYNGYYKKKEQEFFEKHKEDFEW